MSFTSEEIAALGAAFETGFVLVVSVSLVGVALSELLGLIKK